MKRSTKKAIVKFSLRLMFDAAGFVGFLLIGAFLALCLIGSINSPEVPYIKLMLAGVAAILIGLWLVWFYNQGRTKIPGLWKKTIRK